MSNADDQIRSDTMSMALLLHFSDNPNSCFIEKKIKAKFRDDWRGAQTIFGNLLSIGYLEAAKIPCLEGHDTYKMSWRGDTLLETSPSQNIVENSFNNNQNTNIANRSDNVSQTIDIRNQPEDILEKIEELKQAIDSQDTPAIKKAFNYILDKSVDVGVAILAGGLIR